MNINKIVDYANQFLSKKDKIDQTDYPSLERIGGENFFIKNNEKPDFANIENHIYNELLKYINYCHEIILKNDKLNDSLKQKFIELKEKHLNFINNEKDVFTIEDYINDFELFLNHDFDYLFQRRYHENKNKNKL